MILLPGGVGGRRMAFTFQNASLSVVGGDTTERLTCYLNKALVNENSRCLVVKETTRMLVDIPGTLSHVNETRRSLFEGGIYILL